MKLLSQPGDSITSLIKALQGAKKSIDIAIFRFDRKEIEKVLVDAVHRGVRVRALIAYTNRGGEKSLRDLEARMLKAGITVARTADDLVRYHAKYLIVDARILFVLAFNFTHLDIEQSRSFGVITDNKKAVDEASKLFEMDLRRQPYIAGLNWLVVSPANARLQILEYLKGAKKELLIYDPQISDPAMLRALRDRAKAGVSIRIIGRATKTVGLEAAKLHQLRLHTRAILRDGQYVFLGSQSLRTVELDRRREVGIIFKDAALTAQIKKIFEEDWTIAIAAKQQRQNEPVGQVAKKVAKAVAKDIGAMAPIVQGIVDGMTEQNLEVSLNAKELQDTVEDAVKQAVKSVIKEVVQEVEEPGAKPPA